MKRIKRKENASFEVTTFDLYLLEWRQPHHFKILSATASARASEEISINGPNISQNH